MINYGVIVGRFQVNNLHPGHLELFRQVSEKHERVIMFIGISRTIATKRNPLDFETRKKMIQADFPDFIILPLQDEQSDKYWSIKLDAKIGEVTQFKGEVTLYGGRDSFLPHYFGTHPVTELQIPKGISGEEIREKLSNRVMQSPDFRTGAIYAATNQRPRVIMAVDIAILHDTGSKTKLLLVKKPGEDKWRFPGGFVEPGESLEYAARREAYEETLLDISSLKYVNSFPLEDWRYKKETDFQISSALFTGWSMTLKATASDDINLTAWFNLDDLPQESEIEPVHLASFVTLRNRLFSELRGIYVEKSPTTNR